MALGPDKTSLWLASGLLYRGIWASAELIGTDAERPREKFSGIVIGTVKAGGQVVNLPKTFVEAKTLTPRALFRKDVIEQPFTLECELFEFTGDSLSIFMNRAAQLAYSVTSPVSEDWDIIHLGADGPAMVEAGWLIRALDVNKREVEIAMYAGLLTPEDQAINQSGDDYPVLKLKIEATEYTAQTNRERNYGYLARRVA